MQTRAWNLFMVRVRRPAYDKFSYLTMKMQLQTLTFRVSHFFKFRFNSVEFDLSMLHECTHNQLIIIWLVVWNMLYFSIYWECHHPNWLSYFSEGVKPPNSNSWRFSWLKRRSSIVEMYIPSHLCAFFFCFCYLGISYNNHRKDMQKKHTYIYIYIVMTWIIRHFNFQKSISQISKAMWMLSQVQVQKPHAIFFGRLGLCLGNICTNP